MNCTVKSLQFDCSVVFYLKLGVVSVHFLYRSGCLHRYKSLFLSTPDRRCDWSKGLGGGGAWRVGVVLLNIQEKHYKKEKLQ